MCVLPRSPRISKSLSLSRGRRSQRHTPSTGHTPPTGALVGLLQDHAAAKTALTLARKAESIEVGLYKKSQCAEWLGVAAAPWAHLSVVVGCCRAAAARYLLLLLGTGRAPTAVSRSCARRVAVAFVVVTAFVLAAGSQKAKCDSVAASVTAFCGKGNGLIADAATTECRGSSCMKSVDEKTCCHAPEPLQFEEKKQQPTQTQSGRSVTVSATALPVTCVPDRSAAHCKGGRRARGGARRAERGRRVPRCCWWMSRCSSLWALVSS